MGRHLEKHETDNSVFCLECDRRLHLRAKADVGDVVTCPSCDSEFEIVKLKPARIEWAYDDLYDDEEYEDEEEDDDEYAYPVAMTKGRY